MQSRARLFWSSVLLTSVAGVVGSLVPFRPIELNASQITEVAFVNTHQPSHAYPMLHASKRKDEQIIKQLVRWLSQSALIETHPSRTYLRNHPAIGIQAQIVIGNIHSGHYIWLIPLRNHEVYVLSTDPHQPPRLLDSAVLDDWLMHVLPNSP